MEKEELPPGQPAAARMVTAGVGPSSGTVSPLTSGTAAVTPPKEERVAKPRRKVQPLPLPKTLLPYLTAAGMFALACVIWRADGFFTLVFLQTHWPSIHSWGILQWLIPLLITAATLRLWPRIERFRAVMKARDIWVESESDQHGLRYLRLRKQFIRHTMLFLLVTGFNIGTSVSGLMIWGAGRTFDLFGGLTLPQNGAGLFVFAIIGGAIGAFAPEQMARWAEAELKDL